MSYDRRQKKYSDSFNSVVPDGYIYILTNSFIPNIYKIGYTERSAHIRAKEISRATGVPGEWVVARDWPVLEAYQTEQLIFTKFRKYRIGNNEMFDFKGMSVNGVIKNIEEILSERQSHIRDSIEKAKQEEVSFQKREVFKKKVMQKVEQALAKERANQKYIYRIKQTIEEVYGKQTKTKIKAFKKSNNELRNYAYTTIAISLTIAILADITSIFYYGLVGAILFFIYQSYEENIKSIEKAKHKENFYLLGFLPDSLEKLKPIMKDLKINRVININDIKIDIKLGNNLVNLQTKYKGIHYRENYNKDEKNALTDFIVFLTYR